MVIQSRGSDAIMKRCEVTFFVSLFLLLGIPAYAYGDPTGGLLFQVLMPMLAGIWAAWLIFANRLRRGVACLIRKLRGSEGDEPIA